MFHLSYFLEKGSPIFHFWLSSLNILTDTDVKLDFTQGKLNRKKKGESSILFELRFWREKMKRIRGE